MSNISIDFLYTLADLIIHRYGDNHERPLHYRWSIMGILSDLGYKVLCTFSDVYDEAYLSKIESEVGHHIIKVEIVEKSTNKIMVSLDLEGGNTND